MMSQMRESCVNALTRSTINGNRRPQTVCGAFIHPFFVVNHHGVTQLDRTVYSVACSVENVVFLNAVQPWSFSEQCIELNIESFGKPLLDAMDRCLGLLSHMTNKAIVRIRRLEVRYPRGGAAAAYDRLRRIFVICHRLKSLKLFRCNQSTTILGICVKFIPKLRQFRCDDLRVIEINSVNKDKFRKLRYLKARLKLEYNLSSESGLQFVRSLQSVTVIKIRDNGDALCIIEECKHFTNLRHMTLIGETFGTNFMSYITMPCLMSFSLRNAQFWWSELAVACPRLLRVKLSKCMVAKLYASHTYATTPTQISRKQPLLRLKAVELTRVTWYYDTSPNKCFLPQMTATALCTMATDLEGNKLADEIDGMMNHLTLLIDCRVKMGIKDIIEFQTSRVDRIRVYLKKGCIKRGGDTIDI